MKILLINHFPLQGSGSGIYTLNVAMELSNQGHDIFVIDIDNQESQSHHPFARRTIICDSTKNEKYDLPFNFPCFTTHPRSHTTFYDLNVNEMQQYVDTFIKITKEVCEEFKPEVIHAQHLWIAPFAAYKSGIPYVVTAHGTDLMGFKKDERYHPYALEGMRNSKKVITISKQVHQDVKDLYNTPEEQLMLNPNGFDDSTFRVLKLDRKKILAKFRVKGNAKNIVGFVGKFTKFKGVDTLLDAAEIVCREVPETTFILAGDGELREQLEQRSRDLKLGNIIFLGHRNQIEIAELFNLSDVAVVPSRIEPFGLVAIEALACGTPVVATNAGGLPDFINDEIGQLVEMDSPEMLAKAIITELNNSTKLTKGKAAAKFASQGFSWKKTLENVITLYKESI